MRVDLVGERIVPALQVFGLQLFNLLFFPYLFRVQKRYMSGKGTEYKDHKKLKEQYSGKTVTLECKEQ
jgi:hypothetical protein